MKKLLAVLFIALVCTTVYLAAATTQGVEVSGTACNERLSSLGAGWTITISDYPGVSATTNAQGRFTLRCNGVLAGNHGLIATKGSIRLTTDNPPTYYFPTQPIQELGNVRFCRN